MLITRNGQSPTIHPSTLVASSAQIIGNVTIGESCYIDYNVVIESSGTPIEIADHVIVLANSVVCSVGGPSRSPFPVRIDDHTLISPSCALEGHRSSWVSTTFIKVGYGQPALGTATPMVSS
jgi:carbonic anhydrase/acetyltransferase-like protein (isoleucine patch superfamily)